MKNTKKSILLIAMVGLLLTVAVSGTLAYLVDVTGEVRNTFTPSKVTCEVVETGWNDGDEAKSSVQIKNTGDVDAYIRAAVIANWCNAQGQVIAPYSLNLSLGTNWEQNGDYYYYKLKVSPNSLTGNLLAQAIATPDAAPANADHLEVTIVCQAVQADGTDVDGKKPVVQAWGVDPTMLQ